MSDVFLDTVGLLAILNADDQWHLAAKSARAGLLTAGRDFVTTPFVLCETGNSLARTTLRDRVCAIRIDLMERGRVVDPEALDIQVAWSNYERDYANRAGIVDCISFAVMRRLGLSDVFTNDQHFAAAGFTPLF